MNYKQMNHKNKTGCRLNITRPLHEHQDATLLDNLQFISFPKSVEPYLEFPRKQYPKELQLTDLYTLFIDLCTQSLI